MSVELRIVRLPHAADLPLPAHHSAHAAGLDLLAAVPPDAPIELAPGGRALVPTGIAVALPPGNEGQIRPRSGLAIRHGVTVLNSPGTIDADYRGELQVILVNLGTESFVIRRGMRIAQMRFHEVRGQVGKIYNGNYVGEAARGPVPSKAWKQFKEKS